MSIVEIRWLPVADTEGVQGVVDLPALNCLSLVFLQGNKVDLPLC